MNKSMKLVAIGIFTLFIIFLIALIIQSALSRISGRELILEKAALISFNGTIDSVYYDTSNHNTKTVVLSDKFIYGLYPEWESKVDMGDSLIKQKGVLKVQVYKKDGQRVILDYNQLVNNGGMLGGNNKGF